MLGYYQRGGDGTGVFLGFSGDAKSGTARAVFADDRTAKLAKLRKARRIIAKSGK